MKRRVHTTWAILTSLVIALSGCRPQQPFYLREDGDLSHYLDVATDLDYPDVEAATLAEVTQALPPYTLDNVAFASYWDMSLEEAIQIALCNSKVFRSLGGRFVSSAFNNRAQTGEAPNAITLGPDQVRTIYDPAIAESTPFNGVEFALSAFDAQWSTNFFYQNNDRQQNVLPAMPITDFFQQVFRQKLSTFSTQLSKITAQGGQFTLSNNITYDLNNNPTRQTPKDWNVNYELSFNQPLLAGAGVEYNRIAGPFSPFLQVVGGGPPTSQQIDGVVLARINVDISLADFEDGVRDLVNETESAYWELAFAWRNLETANTALNSARQTWQKINVLFQISTRGGEAKEEAQAREQFYQFKSQTQTLLNELFRAENRLRYALGLAPTDGRLIRPIDQPTIAKVEFDWCEITEEALARSLELRRQKWRVKQQELQLIAAKNLLLPRLDLNGLYRFQGLGDDLFGRRDFEFSPEDPFALTGSSALQTLASGQFQEWQLGFQSTMTLGFRRELNDVRHFQLQIARARAVLQDMELEISHQLADAVRQLELNYELTQTNFNRTLAADRQVDALQAAFEAETVTLDQLLEAQRRRAEAQTSFFRTLLDYQRAIITVHSTKGSLLEYNNVYLQEGLWPDKAQFDAHRLARKRDAGIYLNYGYTRPEVVSQGAVRQNPEGHPLMPRPRGVPADANAPEELPTPAPDATLPVPDANPAEGELTSHVSIAPNNTQMARQFQWGPLGLKPANAPTPGDTWTRIVGSSESAPAQGDTWSRIVGQSDDARDNRRPVTRSALQKIEGHAPRPAVPTAPRRDSRVRPINHLEQQPDSQPSSGHESVPHQPTRPTARPAASWQGS